MILYEVWVGQDFMPEPECAGIFSTRELADAAGKQYAKAKFDADCRLLAKRPQWQADLISKQAQGPDPYCVLEVTVDKINLTVDYSS